MSGGDDIVSVGSLGCARASWKKGSLKSSMCFSSEMRPLQASLSVEHHDYVDYYLFRLMHGPRESNGHL